MSTSKSVIYGDRSFEVSTAALSKCGYFDDLKESSITLSLLPKIRVDDFAQFIQLLEEKAWNIDLDKLAFLAHYFLSTRAEEQLIATLPGQFLTVVEMIQRLTDPHWKFAHTALVGLLLKSIRSMEKLDLLLEFAPPEDWKIFKRGDQLAGLPPRRVKQYLLQREYNTAEKEFLCSPHHEYSHYNPYRLVWSPLKLDWILEPNLLYSSTDSFPLLPATERQPDDISIEQILELVHRYPDASVWKNPKMMDLVSKVSVGGQRVYHQIYLNIYIVYAYGRWQRVLQSEWIK